MEDKKSEEKKEIEYHESITDPKEIKILEDFKHSIATITDKKDKAVLDPFVLLNNDFLICFLRARKLNVKKATRMLLDYYHWKAKINLDDVYKNFVFKEKYRLQLLFPHGFHKYSKDGNPIYFQIMGKLNPDELFKIGTPEDLIKYSAQISETMERDYFKLCSKVKNKYVHGVFNIIDFRGIKTTSLLNKKLISYLKDFYSAVKLFLDSKTRGKIKVFGVDYKAGLLDKIDADCLPSFWGGNCNCPGGCLFSNAGPWKKEDEKEVIPEEILKGRNEMTEYMFSAASKNNDNEEKVKNVGKEGLNPDNI